VICGKRVLFEIWVFKIGWSLGYRPVYSLSFITLGMSIGLMYSPVSTTLLTAATVYICVAWLTQYLKLKRSNPAGLPYPPGPKGLPLVGSILEMHGDQEWFTYYKWSRKYGTSYDLLTYLVLQVAHGETLL
jgi:hypothetical protein